MNKRLIALIVLILIVGVWIVSRHWVFTSDISGDPASGQDQVNEQEPISGSNPGSDLESEQKPDPDEEERVLAELLEAERLEEERLEAERLEIERLEEEERASRRILLLEDCRLLLRGYFYDEALLLLNEDENLIDHETLSLEAEIVEAKSRLTRFDGDVKHIFFRSLILYPDHLFSDLDVPTGGFNEGFIYQSEFSRLLPQLFERGYVLYGINELFQKDASGKIQQRDIYLPPGKKPLIISIDDPSYRHGIGFADKVILDSNGELATEVTTPAGETVITYDGDVHLIIDAFVREFPEFSYRGGKGIIAATGYMGIFGYDLITDESKRDAQVVSDRFKENGWIFANYSYTQNKIGFWGTESSPENIKFDVGRWRDAIEPVVGQTNIFVAPFGFVLPGDGMQVIFDNGYDIYCTMDNEQAIVVHDTYVLFGRLEIGGYSLVRRASMLNRDFFDVGSVIDPDRPPVLSR